MGTDAATTPVSTYRYDPNGLRILKTTADTETLYTYGVDGTLLEETRMVLADPGQTVRLDFVHAFGTILAWQERTGTITRRYWAITDHLGSVTGASDESGTLVMRQDYDAFGNPHDALLPALTGPALRVRTGMRKPDYTTSMPAGMILSWEGSSRRIPYGTG